MKEQWKTTTVNADYEVSNLGRVRSNKHGKVRVLKPFKSSNKVNSDKYGFYLSVRLLNNGTEKDYSVHRLVAMAFIPNPNNLPCVNHKNGLRSDNSVENLEWCDASYNTWHSYHILGNKNGTEKKVYQFSKDGVLIREWESISSASNELGIDSSSISSVCKKNSCRKIAGGYIWRYEGDDDVEIKYEKASPVVQISKYGDFIKRFDTIQEASVEVGISEGGIAGCCKKNNCGYNYAGGYLWRYEKDYNEKEFGYYKDKTFIKMTMNNIFVEEYKGVHELIDNSDCELIKVIMCCKGQRKSTNGFRWCVKEEGNKTRETKREKPVVKLTKDFVFISEYSSAVEASKNNNVCSTNIGISCKHKGKYNVKGYKWMYKKDYDDYLTKT
jgi:hypothetical protein